MNPLLRLASLLLILVMLTACAAPPSLASAPTITPALRALPQAVEAAPTDRVELAAGRYQLIMFYSPI
jgi:hypothetical protein